MKENYDKSTMKEAFGEILRELAENDSNIYAVSADTEISMGYQRMAQAFRDRVINVGICEQNMALVAVGLASNGAKVFIATYAPFASMRILEQIRSYIAYSKMDVKVISAMGGLSGGEEGVTHQGIEDLSIIRTIPNMVVIVAADACSTQAITRKITEYVGPVYFRMARHKVHTIFSEYNFEIGRANVIKQNGADATVICNGPILYRVIETINILREHNVDVSLVEMPCIKPIDREAILYAARKTGRIITIEENNSIGGLGSAVAEIVTESYPVPVFRIGINDEYAESGDYEELLDKYGFSVSNLVDKMLSFINGYKGTKL